MSHIPIADPDDPRIQVYRHLKTTNLTRWSGRFIAEGKLVVQRLFDSEFAVESVLVSDVREEELRGSVPDEVPVYVVPLAQARELVGYRFHSGVLACGIRPPSIPLPELLAPQGNLLLVALNRLTDPENLGMIIRIAAAFGADAVLLERGCADPFSRRALRTSMGAAFTMPIYESAALLSELREYREATGLQLVAAVLAAAVPLAELPRAERLCVAFGNEKDGLSPAWMNAADERCSIPMSPGVDSLNVSVAAGIFLYHFTGRLYDGLPRPSNRLTASEGRPTAD
jgi:tRNA G18 (ribose-2'-O)-methylase SpoU